jgi:hypothetical protein
MLYHRPEGAALHTVSNGLKEISEAFFCEGWHINKSLAVAAAAAAGIMAGLDHVNRAAILLDDMGLVVRMNAAAEHLIGHGVTVSSPAAQRSSST